MLDINIQQLRAPYLKLAKDGEHFALHRAALEWDIEEPIVIENPEDLKSTASWHDLLDPFHHQVRNLITFCRRLPVTLLADDVGLGKTISAGLILSELLSRKRVNKTLIICPKILMPQWREELASKFNIEADYGSGIDAIRKALSKLRKRDTGVFITTYASARDHLNRFQQAGFQMMILDEAHKLRNLYGVQSPPKIAIRMREALANRTFKYVLMLTATPIQNRLWDLYSLIDLLTVARGHQNPFGSEERFARRYIADATDQARKLNLKYKDEFRSIVYGYMSRVRRGDARLSFPARKVRLHHTNPTRQELQLVDVVGKEIQSLNKLSQISLLKALVSSPQALTSQVEHMAEKGTLSKDSFTRIADAADRITITSKLQSLGVLADQLRRERPGDWRMVVFTQLLQTQRVICEYLESNGIAFGTISGESARRNQETIRRFAASPPAANVVVSTEAGAEGVNLQVANVLVNYDLPWNPMIVEQRIGRLQRLGSKHANVTIFNVVLKETFEEYIVGRLMEKLQLAATAIGDIDSLLEAAGLDDDEGEVTGFEEMIRRLVVSSLAGKNVEEDTKRKAESIEQAKAEIAREEENINALLGDMSDPLKKGPRAPKMSPPLRSMSVKDFALAVFRALGRNFVEEKPGIYVDNKTFERITFNESINLQGTAGPTICVPGRVSFDRLVSNFLGEHESLVDGIWTPVRKDLGETCARWSASFGGSFSGHSSKRWAQNFSGQALARARVSVAHDSFEKIIEVDCKSSNPAAKPSAASDRVDAAALGIPESTIIAAITHDPDIREFSRFYLERRAEEVKAAGDDQRMAKKLGDEFTPKLEPSLVGLKGKISKHIEVEVNYQLQGKGPYTSIIQLDNETGQVIRAPSFEQCQVSKTTVPGDCLETCAVTNKRAVRHLLTKSEASSLYALPEHIVNCAISGKRVISSETVISSMTGKPCLKKLTKTSAISGKVGEPSFFGRCAFTNCDALAEELATSQVSGKSYRRDQERSSTVSGKTGHRSEFIECAETGKILVLSEAERCDATSAMVAPGVLVKCEVSGRRVRPGLIGNCTVSGKKVYVDLLQKSSVSGALMLKEHAIASKDGQFCLPTEAIRCGWDGSAHHPADVAVCDWTGVQVCKENLDGRVLKHLRSALNSPPGIVPSSPTIERVVTTLSAAIGKGNYTVQCALYSPNGYGAAFAVESRVWFGLRKRILGFVYVAEDDRIVGRVVGGRRENGRWKPD